MRAEPVGRTAAPFVQLAYLMTDGQMHLSPMLGQTLDRRKLLIPSDDDCDVSRRSSLLRKHAHPARTQTRTLWPSTWLLLKAMGAGPTGRITYAAGGRLDGIGRLAIGDMVSSAVASSFEVSGCYV
jgi:hypothetical protein